jgi:hypothetical protein
MISTSGSQRARRRASPASTGLPASRDRASAAVSNISPALMFELWGMVRASQPGIASTHSVWRRSQRSEALGVSIQLTGSAGTCSLRKITLRWRFLPSSTVAVHS